MFQRKPVGEVQRRFTVQLPVSLDDFLERLAKAAGVSKSNYIRDLVAMKRLDAECRGEKGEGK